MRLPGAKKNSLARPVRRRRHISRLDQNLKRPVARAGCALEAINKLSIRIGQVTAIPQRIAVQWVGDQVVCRVVRRQAPEAIDGRFAGEGESDGLAFCEIEACIEILANVLWVDGFVGVQLAESVGVDVGAGRDFGAEVTGDGVGEGGPVVAEVDALGGGGQVG